MRTEAEAKTKWCPLIRIGAESNQTWAMNNREERIGVKPEGEISRCIGSACMAWLWGETKTQVVSRGDDATPEGEGWEKDASREYDGQNTRTFWRRQRPDRKGYCGEFGDGEEP